MSTCGRVAPGTCDEDIDASVPAIRCQLTAGHPGRHAAMVEFTDRAWLEPPESFRLERDEEEHKRR